MFKQNNKSSSLKSYENQQNKGNFFLPIKKSLKLKVGTEDQAKKRYITCLDLVYIKVWTRLNIQSLTMVYLFNRIKM